MCNLKTDFRQALDILRLHFNDGFSQRKIAKVLGISRKTVSRIIKRFVQSGHSWPISNEKEIPSIQRVLFPSPNKSVSAKDKPNMVAVFEEMKIKGATLQQLHLEYLAHNPNGIGYSQFCTYYREYKKTLKRSLRIEHFAGEKVFVDYAGPTVAVYLSGEEVRQAQIFVGVLGASNYIYADAVWSQSRQDWISSHVRMFEHFGGVPVMVVCDNLKSGVSKSSRTNPVVQSDYAEMARHFNTSIFPARAYKPQDKSKAEGGVLIVERWIMFRLRKQVFTSLEELNLKIQELLTEVNKRPFQKLNGNRVTAFETIDKPALKDLPSSTYVYRQFKKVQVPNDYHINVEKHFYSVPHTLVRRVVEVIYTANTVEVMHNGRRVALHQRSHNVCGHTTEKSHLPESHKEYLYASEGVAEWAASIGQALETFVRKIVDSTRNQSLTYRKIQRVKSLARSYGDLRLNHACEIILRAGGDKVDAVESVLKNNIDLSQNESNNSYDADFEHHNIRGSEYYH